MTKQKLSLQEFYAKTPGDAPIEYCLPSKPGEAARVADQQNDVQHSYSNGAAARKPSYTDRPPYENGRGSFSNGHAPVDYASLSDAHDGHYARGPASYGRPPVVDSFGVPPPPPPPHGAAYGGYDAPAYMPDQYPYHHDPYGSGTGYRSGPRGMPPGLNGMPGGPGFAPPPPPPPPPRANGPAAGGAAAPGAAGPPEFMVAPPPSHQQQYARGAGLPPPPPGPYGMPAPPPLVEPANGGEYMRRPEHFAYMHQAPPPHAFGSGPEQPPYHGEYRRDGLGAGLAAAVPPYLGEYRRDLEERAPPGEYRRGASASSAAEGEYRRANGNSNSRKAPVARENGNGQHSNGSAAAYTRSAGPDSGPNSSALAAPDSIKANGKPPLAPPAAPASPDVNVRSNGLARPGSASSEPSPAPPASPPPAQQQDRDQQPQQQPQTQQQSTEVPLLAEPKEDAAQTTSVKNEWAEKLAAQAMAKMLAAKSSLLAGNGASSGTAIPDGRPPIPTSSSLNAPSVRPRLSLQPRSGPAYNSGAHTPSSPAASDRGRQQDGALTSGGDSDSDWRARPQNGPPQLRSSLAADGNGNGEPGYCSSGSPTPAPAGSAAAPGPGGRPRLNLVPRSKPIAPAGDAQSKASSIFGAARPREEVLKNRGIDPVLADLAGRPELRHSHTAYSSHAGSVAASATSGDDDQWAVVGRGGRAKVMPGDDAGNALLDDVNPFFASGGSGSAGYSHGVAVVGRAIPQPRGVYGSYGGGGGSYNKMGSSFGSNGGGGHMASYGGHGVHDDEDGPIFRRALPTRSDHVF